MTLQRKCRPGWIALFALVAGCATVEAPPEGRSAPAGVEAVRRSPLTAPPGALLADVTQASISTTICVPRWTGLVRPSSSFTQGVKLKFLREASINRAEAVNFELDHFVPLALGGHPRSIDNLWLQRWDGPWSALAKDRLERRLQVMVCAGRLTLAEARMAIAKNWQAAYTRYVVPKTIYDLETQPEALATD